MKHFARVIQFCCAAVVATLTCSAASPISGTLVDAHGRQPRLAVDPVAHRCAVVYASGEDICLAWITDAGSIAPPQKVAHVDGLMVGMRRGPQAAITSGTLVITACGSVGDLLAYRIGQKQPDPVRINHIAGSAREGLASICADHGVFYASWLDAGSTGAEVHVSSSHDLGRTWSLDECAYASPDGHVCECCQPQIACAGDTVAVMWRNWINGNRDMWMTTLGRRPAAPPAKLGSGSWPLNACPMDGGALCVLSEQDRPTTGVAVWRREKKLFVTRVGFAAGLLTESASEQFLADGRNATCCAASSAKETNDTFIAWQSNEGKIFVLPPGTSQPSEIGAGYFPVIAATGTTSALLAWDANPGVYVARAP
jgi:hypothetical protein